MMRRILTLILLFLPAFGFSTRAQSKAVYSIASEKSKMEIHVYKEGFFKAFGHDHLIAARGVSGSVEFDEHNIGASAVRLKVATKSLVVVDSGGSQKDRQDVQATMVGEKVLDVAKYPEIEFTSTTVSSVKKTAQGWDAILSGRLKLHGVEKEVRFPIHVSTETGRLSARGEVSLLQTEYRITPVKAGGGAVKVKDKVTISFTIVAIPTNR